MPIPTIGQEVVAGKYGPGKVTEIGPISGCGGSVLPDWIGVTPYEEKYQMNFAPHNVKFYPFLQSVDRSKICEEY